MNRIIVAVVMVLIMIVIAILPVFKNIHRRHEEPVFKESERVTTLLSGQNGQITRITRYFYGDYIYTVKFFTPENFFRDKKYTYEDFKGYELVKANK